MTVIGAPGIGKTRLVQELRRYVDELPGLIRWRRGRSLSYGAGVAFWALGEMVKAEAGILESDSAQAAGRKLDEAVAAVMPNERDRDWAARHLRPLVGLERGLFAVPVTTAGWRRSRRGGDSSRRWPRIVRRCSCSRTCTGPTTRCSTSSSAGRACRRGAAAGRLHRPSGAAGAATGMERRHDQRADDPAPAAVLGGHGAAGRRVARPGARCPPAQLEDALERAEGNPLYAQEYVRMLRDQGCSYATAPVGRWGEPERRPSRCRGSSPRVWTR